MQRKRTPGNSWLKRSTTGSSRWQSPQRVWKKTMTEGAPCRSAVETVDPSESVTVKLGRGDPIPTLSPAAASSFMHDAMVSAGKRKARRKNKVVFMVLGAKIHQTSVVEFVLSLQSVAIKIGQESGRGGEILPSR